MNYLGDCSNIFFNIIIVLKVKAKHLYVLLYLLPFKYGMPAWSVKDKIRSTLGKRY